MYEDIRKQFFPMKLPSGVVCHSLDKEAAQASIRAIKVQIFVPRQEWGLYQVPEARREKLSV